MPPRSAFEYAIVRVVPDVEREEFVNAGLILFCRERRYLRAATHLDVDALRALHHDCDVPGLREQLEQVERIADGSVTAGRFAGMDQSQRFHWLTTPRSTLVQPGPLHAGVTEDPDATFAHLWATLVERRGR